MALHSIQLMGKFGAFRWLAVISLATLIAGLLILKRRNIVSHYYFLA